MSVTSHGNITLDNLEEAKRKTALYGPQRVILSVIVKCILTDIGSTWTIDSGTLLGAWRDEGKMLEHDDDFDFVIFAPGIDQHKPNRDKKCHAFLTTLSEEFEERLPFPYKCRVVNTYCKKLEIYDPEKGDYPFSPLPTVSTNYHNVTCDVMIILCGYSDSNMYLQHEKLRHVKIPSKYFFNSGEIEMPTIRYEGSSYNCPSNPEGYLTSIYGYVGRNAAYNPKTQFYEPREQFGV